MKKREKDDLLKDCTSKMSIDIDGIPKEKCFEIAEMIGNILIAYELKFTYGGIGEGFSGRVGGIQFDIEKE